MPSVCFAHTRATGDLPDRPTRIISKSSTQPVGRTGFKSASNKSSGRKILKKKQIVIYGKNSHAEVLGLVGQTGGQAIVISCGRPKESWISLKHPPFLADHKVSGRVSGDYENTSNSISPDATFSNITIQSAWQVANVSHPR